jgi:hypothetical protein
LSSEERPVSATIAPVRELMKRLVSEPGAQSAGDFRRRVRLLAGTYAVLFVSSTGGAVVLALHGKLFVTLAQRSNVETLTIAFLLVFYAYLAALSGRGALGAARIFFYALRRKVSRDPRAERRRQAEMLKDRDDGPWAALSRVVQRTDGAPLRFALADEDGDYGALEVDGARVTQVRTPAGSADLIAYFVRQIAEVAGEDVSVVAWGQLDEDEGEKYLAQVEFARALQRQLGAPPLWPTVALSPAHCDAVAERLARIMPALLEDALLPDWEYQAEHKLPVIPEPLGLVSLGRSAKRADPVATMGFATLMVLLTFGVIVLFILHKPWVPG